MIPTKGPASAAQQVRSAGIPAAPRTFAGRSRTATGLAPGQSLYVHRSPYLPVQFHIFHPSAFNTPRFEGYLVMEFYSGGRTIQLLLLRDFLSGTYIFRSRFEIVPRTAGCTLDAGSERRTGRH
jgi:hypothetical protein